MVGITEAKGYLRCSWAIGAGGLNAKCGRLFFCEIRIAWGGRFSHTLWAAWRHATWKYATARADDAVALYGTMGNLLLV